MTCLIIETAFSAPGVAVSTVKQEGGAIAGKHRRSGLAFQEFTGGKSRRLPEREARALSLSQAVIWAVPFARIIRFQKEARIPNRPRKAALWDGL